MGCFVVRKRVCVQGPPIIALAWGVKQIDWQASGRQFQICGPHSQKDREENQLKTCPPVLCSAQNFQIKDSQTQENKSRKIAELIKGVNSQGF